MRNFIILELDTTPPILSIECPKATVFGRSIEVYIHASEELAMYQDIYFTDVFGNRHPVTFAHRPNYFYGIVNFTGKVSGLYTLHARLKDTVDNLSDEVTHTIYVSLARDIGVSIADTSLELSIVDIGVPVNIVDTSCIGQITEASNSIVINDLNREVVISE